MRDKLSARVHSRDFKALLPYHVRVIWFTAFVWVGFHINEVQLQVGISRMLKQAIDNPLVIKTDLHIHMRE